MNARENLAARLPEIIFVFLSSWGMAQVGYNGFYISDVQHGLLPPVIIFMLVLVLFVAASSRRRWVPVGILYVLIVAALVAASMALSGGKGGFRTDQAGSYLYFMLVTVASPTLCFLMSRILPGCALWFAVVAFTCAIVDALYDFNEYAFSLIASTSGLALLLWRNASSGKLQFREKGAASPVSRGFTSLGLALSGLAVAAVVWFAIISPLDPGHLNVKLFTEYIHQPTIEMQGVASINPVYDFSRKSDNLVDGDRDQVTDLKVDDNATDEVEARALREWQQRKEDNPGSKGGGNSAGTQDTIDESSTQRQFEAMNYLDDFPWPLVVIAVVALLLIAAIVAFFLLRRRRRFERLAKLLDAEPRAQVEGLYSFLLVRLGRIGFKVPEGQTLSEWSRGSARRMDTVCESTGVSFEDCTATYCECAAYGQREPSQEEVDRLVAFYDGFWRGARAHLGNVRYFFKSFRL